MLRIERRERQLFWLAVVAGIGLWTYSRWPASLRSDRLAPWVPIFLVIGPSLLVYALTTRLHSVPWLYRQQWLVPVRPCWGVRRHPWIDLFLAIAAGYVAYRIYFQLFEIVTWQLVSAVIVGSGLGLYLVAMLANPRSALVVVNCPAADCVEEPGQGVGRPSLIAVRTAPEKAAAQSNLHSLRERIFNRSLADPAYPLVWPFNFVAQVGGAVIWQLTGPAGYRVEIDFPQEHFRPFGPDRHHFSANVPGTLAVGPVVSGGCGHYELTLYDAQNKVLANVDPLGDDPPGDGRKGGGG